MIPKISSKDRSLLLLIASGLALLWFSFSFFSQAFFSSAYSTSDAAKILTQYENDKSRWLNVAEPLKKSDLKNRIILLDFWTYACVNCIHIIPEIKKLEQEFGEKLMVIGVHSGKFDNEKDFEAIKKAVLKYDITHPVVNDSELKIWKFFEINAWPSLILIDPHGNVQKRYVGEEDVQYIRKDVKRLINKYRYQLNRNELPQILEKNKLAERVLSYPTKITYSKNFSYKSHNGPALFVANSGQNTIVATTISGEIIVEIGSQKNGFSDGDFANAQFNNPTGLLYKNNKLLVADSNNHAIREIDFKTGKVLTILGNGIRGYAFSEKKVAAKDIKLSSPSDLEFYPDENHIVIANSGTHQILQYNIKDKTASVLAGNGSEGIADGKYPQNSLAQTSDLARYDDKLYFLDSETSSLRVINKSGEVKTLIGKGLFEFGQKNGDRESALMQHPLGLAVNNSAAYITDSFNHALRKYDFGSKKLQDVIARGEKGDELGAKTNFDEPDGIVIVDNTFFIADTNNNRVIKIAFKDLKSSLVEVMPPLRLPQEGLLQYLPNLNKEVAGKINDEGIVIKINLQDDWKLNESGPSFLNLLEVVSLTEANLIKTFDWNMIKNQDLELPKLDANKKYILQGTIYYCEDRKNAPCYVSSYEQEFSVSHEEKNKTINVELIYK